MTIASSLAPLPPSRLVTHFSARDAMPQQQMLAWRDRVGHILDVPVTHAQIASGFSGTIDSYRVGATAFMDSRTDPLIQQRTAALISRDNMRDFVFHVAIEGSMETATGLYPQRKAAQIVPGILALDMNQPMRMERPTACRVLALFLPRSVVDAVLPDAESIHGRVVDYSSPATRAILHHLTVLGGEIAAMDAAETQNALDIAAQLLIAAFGKQARLSGSAPAAGRALMFAQARRYIQDNLHQPELSPENVVRALQASRPTVYRLFEQEGGLGTYIRNQRLREAAADLRKYPQRAVMEIAFGLGFKSASDFNHAFRRAYDMTPLDFRRQALLPKVPVATPGQPESA